MTKKDYKKPESKTVMLSGTTILAGSEGGINAGIDPQPGSEDPKGEGDNTGMEITYQVKQQTAVSLHQHVSRLCQAHLPPP